MNQTWENGEKPNIGPDFGSFGSSVTKYHGQKTNDPIQSNNLMIKPSDRRTERQTDESDFIGRCPTNVKRPIAIKII